MAPPAPADPVPARYRATVVASTAVLFQALPAPPAANDQGHVVFYGLAREGVGGIYASSGTFAEAVVTEGMVVDPGFYLDEALFREEFGHELGNRYFGPPERHRVVTLGQNPVVTSDYYYVVTAQLSGGAAILGIRNRKDLDVIADSSEAFRTFGHRFGVNNLHDVVFFATVDPEGHPDRTDGPAEDRSFGQPPGAASPDQVPPPLRMTHQGLRQKLDEGIFFENGENVLVVGGTHADFADAEDGVAVNDHPMVAYRAYRYDGTMMLVLDVGAVQPTILASTGPVYRTFGVPALNNAGEVACTAETRTGESVVLRARLGQVAPQIAARPSARFASFREGVALDETGAILCIARARTGGDVLLMVPRYGPVRELRFDVPRTVVAPAEPLPRLRALSIGPRAFAGFGRVALRAELAPKGEAILLLRPEG